MRENVKQLMDEYCYKSTIDKNNKTEATAECLIYGYLTGYFEEKAYEIYIYETKDLAKIKEYNLGIKMGIYDRLNIKDKTRVNKEKEEWLTKLAISDALNGIRKRNLTTNALNFYNQYKGNITEKLLNSKVIRGTK